MAVGKQERATTRMKRRARILAKAFAWLKSAEIH
jgi:hypothetical protein